MFNREIFRKKALEKLSTPDDLDELLQVNSRLSWILLLSLLCLVLGGVVWVVFGQIVNKVIMIGIIFPGNNFYNLNFCFLCLTKK
jgi:HlyD family secretion protein